MAYYDESFAKVRCNGKFTRLFRTTRGVKQGGPFSPRLFALYIIPLMIKIVVPEHGLRVNPNLKLGVVLYADDTTLLCTSIFSVKAMVEIMEEFGVEFEVKVNGDKTQVIIINNKKPKEN
jgi:hypothetical protein